MHLLANAAKGLFERRHVVNDLLVAAGDRTDLLANLDYIAGAEAFLRREDYGTTPVTYRDNPVLVEDG